MKLNLSLLGKYILALFIGLVFIDIQTRLVGFSASIPFALNEYDWTKEYVELSLFIFNFITYLIPLAFITVIIGYLVSRLLKPNNLIIAFIIVLPSLLLVVSSMSMITQLSFWSLELPRLLIIIFVLWFTIKKYGIQNDKANYKVIE